MAKYSTESIRAVALVGHGGAGKTTLAAAGVGTQLLRYFVYAFPAAGVLIVCTALLSAGIRWLSWRAKASAWRREKTK